MGSFVRVSESVVVFIVLVMMRCEGMNHVVGGDQGWDAASDIASWSINKIFTVGDNIWFTYSAAREGVLEVRSKDEFESCDVSNPIKMFTGGLDTVALDGVGSRYFVSGRPEDCHNGLKLHVQVLPVSSETNHLTNVIDVVADGP
ncbi:uclacyanin 1-like [Dioscorea cayenensis subsp. rotundata]|uniref:Uclacyanin 1-like n=1 Tax=Dioscorea cayennensis subsp. rotundata TaxID=55577 RepID=A0AB40CQA3_DIOCR|nr:uclacyanin 1-like [Dioscorea cayenensis subsp. rotundata]